MLRHTLIAMCAVMVLTSWSSADIPRLINYQGRITDDTGQPIANGDYSIKFKFYGSEAGDDSLWSSGYQAVSVSDGLFTYLLGSAVPFPEGLFDNSITLYLSIQVDPNPELSPRTRLSSVAYAYHALNADTAWVALSVPSSGWVDKGSVIQLETSSDSVGIGTAAPGEKLHVNGNLRLNGQACFGPGATRTGSYAAVLGGNNNAATGNYATVLGGKDNVAANWYSVACGWSDTTIGQNSFAFGENVRVDGAYTFAFGRGFTTTTGNAVVFHSTIGDIKVGIGTPSPTTALHVDGSIRMVDGNQGVGKVLTSDANGIASWQTTAGDGHWTLSDAQLFTDDYYGIARGGASNVMHGDSARTMVNLGVACTTGTNGLSLAWATVGGGRNNSASYPATTVSGGEYNKASGQRATVGGGSTNSAQGDYAVAGGGRQNAADYDYATVAGGYQDTAGASYATVSGGGHNDADGTAATVGGGYVNYALGNYSAVTGGQDNTASGSWSNVGGGNINNASGIYSSVTGGQENTASGLWCSVGGGYSNEAGDNSDDTASCIGGGFNNSINALYSTIAGGQDNSIDSLYYMSPNSWNTIGGGHNNTIWGIGNVISGGSSNTVKCSHGAIVGGQNNEIYGNLSTILGGNDNAVHASSATVIGSHNYVASGTHRAFIIGHACTTMTDYACIIHNGIYEPKVGIQVENPDRILHIKSNSLTDPLADAWMVYSSARWSKNISTISGAVDKIRQLRGVYFDHKETDQHDIGLIAEEVGKVVPEAVTYDKNGIDAESIDYDRIIPLLVEAIKEQQQQIETLKAELELLKRR